MKKLSKTLSLLFLCGVFSSCLLADTQKQDTQDDTMEDMVDGDEEEFSVAGNEGAD